MNNLIIIPIQSFSDIITNSSSELFVLNTNNTIQKVKEILNSITSGYQDPIIFNLESYNKWKEDDSSVSNLESTYFNTVEDWLIDLDSEDSLFEYRLQAFCNIMEYNSFSRGKLVFSQKNDPLNSGPLLFGCYLRCTASWHRWHSQDPRRWKR